MSEWEIISIFLLVSGIAIGVGLGYLVAASIYKPDNRALKEKSDRYEKLSLILLEDRKHELEDELDKEILDQVLKNVYKKKEDKK